MNSNLDPQAAPEPMEALTHTVISPANIALEARLSRAKPLGWFALWKLKRRAKSLQRQIERSGHEKIRERMAELEPELKVLLDYKYQLAQQRQMEPDAKHLHDMWAELRAELEPKYAEYRQLKDKLAYTDQLYEQFKTMQQQIDDNPEVIERAKQEKHKLEIQRQEAKAYEQMIIDRWTQMKYCYRYTSSNGSKHVEEVCFSERHITPEAIYFKIGAGYRHWAGSYKTRIPYGVNISDLVKPETLEELSYACQRQVSAKSDFVNGAWIIVNRLDTTDGLLNQVKYADVMRRYPTKYHKRFPVCVGVAQRKQVQWLNLADYPHWLVAGFTGSGKSNFINAIICTLITQHSPEDVRLTLVDLKEGVEFATYEQIPHLYGPIVNSVAALADKLEELEAVMQERYQEIRGKARSLNEYNAKYPDKRMPRIVCVVDEVASIMSHGDLTKRVNNSFRQLTAKGRAANINIILSTQRPSVDAIDGIIKVNLSARIVGRMPSHVDSMTVLGTGAAKELAPIAGRMVMQISTDPMPIQTPMIEDHDVDEALLVAMSFEKPEAIARPVGFRIEEDWTAEKVVRLSLNHLGGNISHSAVWEEIKDEGSLSRSATRDLVERIWNMDCIELDGKQYSVVRGKGKIRKLQEIVPEPLIDESEHSHMLGDLSVDQVVNQG